MKLQGVLAAQAEEALAAVAKELEIRHGGGTPFFEALDERMRDDYWYRALLLRYLDTYGEQHEPIDVTEIGGPPRFITGDRPYIAVSGKFGQGFAGWLAGSEWGRYVPPVAVFPGDLRHNVLPKLDQDLTGRQYVFMDDSYYKGRTYGQISRRIVEAGGGVLGAIILYDGSPEPAKVPSFFRYHRP